MRILALESSAKAASCALVEDDRLIAQAFQNSGLTHSQTLLPMVEDMLKNCGEGLETVECVAVACGPGSFTGLRIGAAAAKGLAWARGIPCAACSSLEAMAWGLCHMEGRELCAVMDARRQQVYRARFLATGEGLVRLCEDGAVALEELEKELEKPQILVGDGAQLCYNSLKDGRVPLTLAPAHLRFPTAWGVARLGWEKAKRGELTTPEALALKYHRLSQAERERLERLGREAAEENGQKVAEIKS